MRSLRLLPIKSTTGECYSYIGVSLRVANDFVAVISSQMITVRDRQHFEHRKDRIGLSGNRIVQPLH